MILLKNESFVVYTIAILITLFAGIFFEISGYPLVNTAYGTLNISTSPVYMLSIFIPYGILIGELSYHLYIKKSEWFYFYLLIVECVLIGGVSFIRLIAIIPFSGHAVIISYYLLHQIFYNQGKYIMRLILGLVVLIITIFFKIFFWNDQITLLLGFILGIVFWIPEYVLIERSIQKKS